MIPFENAAAPVASTRRRRLGDGMVEPIKVLEYRDQYSRGVQQLRPGRDRVSISWWGYRKNPELFRVANRDDTPTVARHREKLQRTRRLIEREMAGTTRASTSSRQRRFQLPDRRRERFRLP